MKTKTDVFDFTGIDHIVVHKLDDGLESKDHIVIGDKKISDRLISALSKSRKCPCKFFPSFKMDLLLNGRTLYEIYVNEHYLNLSGLVMKSSKNIGKIINTAFDKK